MENVVGGLWVVAVGAGRCIGIVYFLLVMSCMLPGVAEFRYVDALGHREGFKCNLKGSPVDLVELLFGELEFSFGIIYELVFGCGETKVTFEVRVE